jgi:cytochrome c553
MQGLIKVLKDDERLQIALFYANAPVTPAPADPVLTARGKDLFAKLCVRCHGPQARGNEVYPRLAGQKQVYIKTSVTRYRDNTGIRNNQLMSIATGGLKDDEILAISHYLTQLP